MPKPVLTIVAAIALVYGAGLAWLARPLPNGEETRTPAPVAGRAPLPSASSTGLPSTRRETAAPAAPTAPPTNAAPTATVATAKASALPVPTVAAAGDSVTAPAAAPITFRDPFGVERPVPNHTPLESAARNDARARAIAALKAEARRDPVAFARANSIEEPDNVLQMLEGGQPFPESLIDARLPR